MITILALVSIFNNCLLRDQNIYFHNVAAIQLGNAAEILRSDKFQQEFSSWHKENNYLLPQGISESKKNNLGVTIKLCWIDRFKKKECINETIA